MQAHVLSGFRVDFKAIEGPKKIPIAFLSSLLSL